MVKFILEVSEDFIHEKANLENLEQSVEKGLNGLGALVKFVAMAEIEKEIEKGRTEFVISRDKIEGKAVELYDNTLRYAAVLTYFAEEKKNAVQEGK